MGTDLETVIYLIEQYAEINRFSSKGYQPIHVAALHKHPQVISYLLDNEISKANFEALTVQKLTPLHLAAKKENVESMKVLLDNKANIYAVEERNWTALHFAAFHYHKDAVQLLQRYDAYYEKLKYMINSKNASREGNLDIVRRLKTLGQNVDEQTFYNQTTPLMFSVQNQHYLIVKFLIENLANTGIQDLVGKTALDYAYQINNRKIIGLLDSGLQ